VSESSWAFIRYANPSGVEGETDDIASKWTLTYLRLRQMARVFSWVTGLSRTNSTG
jgi:hypothetical protein